MVSDAVVDFLAVARSVSAGSCNALGQPYATRCAALRVQPDRQHVALFIGEVISQTLLRNVTETSRLAVQVSHPSDHRTVQLKGKSVRVGQAPDSDRAFVERWVQELAQVVDQLGMPYERVVRMAHWPATLIELRVEEIYLQTPGPGAGAPLAGRAP
jgi:hypothetical protein